MSNILVLAVAYEGIAVPVLWMFLPKKGNSNTGERVALMNRFIAIKTGTSIAKRCSIF